MEFAAVTAMLLWNLDDNNDPSISEETRAEGRRQKAVVCDEMHDYYTRQGTSTANYALRLAVITSIVHAIDV